MKQAWRTTWIAAIAVLAILVAGCGNSGSQRDPESLPGTQVQAGDASSANARVAVTIDEIGVTSVTPQGWTETTAGLFAYESAELGFGAIPSSSAPDLEEEGFELVEQLASDGRVWNLYDLEAGGVIVRLAATEIGDIAYFVTLQSPATLVEEYAESVLLPALEAFETGEIADSWRILDDLDPADGDLQDLLDELIARTDLPALGVTVFDGETIIETAVSGVRRRGDPTPVEPTDLFHIGSNTKAMTATLGATFVDEGVISWETTVEEIFGDVFPDLDEGLAQVTFRQLLSHTAGFDVLEDERTFLPLLGTDDDLPVTERRFEIAETSLTQPAPHPAGRYEYSNVGYTIVGAMLEELTGTSWEDLVQTRLFDVLGMRSCGFYAPGAPGEVDQPWGHFDERGGEAIDPGDPNAELPHALAPAGLVHCSMSDWALFLQSQLRGFQGSATEIISPEAFVALQTPAESSDYALGWVAVEAPLGFVITHNGSNQRFTSDVLLVPGENWGALVVTNLGAGMAAPTIDAVGEAITTRYLNP